MADDLRDRIATEISDKFGGFPGDLVADVVLAVRDEELERLREELDDARTDGHTAGANYNQATTRVQELEDALHARNESVKNLRSRAEQAEAATERVRALAEQWAGLAPADDWGDTIGDTAIADAGRTILAALDHPAETPATT